MEKRPESNLQAQRRKLLVIIVVVGLLAGVPAVFLALRLTAPVQPDLILHHGVVVTMDGPVAEAVAVQRDRILAVGSDTEILALGGPDTRLLDLGGNAVLPGFIDSHAHWIGDRAVGGHETAEEAIQAALASGWTSISELFVNEERLDALRELDATVGLRLRVNAYLPLNSGDDRYGDWYQAYQPGWEFSSRLRIAGVKVTLDNGPGIGYADRNYWFTQEELDDVLARAHEAGFQLAVHAIVDQAIDTVLNSFERVLGDQPGQYRPRIEHVVMMRDDQLTRMRGLGVVASIQFSWFNSDWTEDILEDPGPEGAPLVARWRDLVDADVHVIGGTDHPWTLPPTTVGPSMKAIHEVVTRVGEQGLPPPSWMLSQRITVEEALRLLTIDAAYGTFQEDEKGSITPGKLADFVVLSANPLAVPQAGLQDIEVLVTIVGGRAEHCDSAYSAWCADMALVSPLPTPPPSASGVALAVPRFVADPRDLLLGGPKDRMA